MKAESDRIFELPLFGQVSFKIVPGVSPLALCEGAAAMIDVAQSALYNATENSGANDGDKSNTVYAVMVLLGLARAATDAAIESIPEAP